MAAAEGLEPIHCACGALVLRVNDEGIELHCRRCDRRWVVPFERLGGKEDLVNHMKAWRAREKRP
jgi:hypothetical protein